MNHQLFTRSDAADIFSGLHRLGTIRDDKAMLTLFRKRRAKLIRERKVVYFKPQSPRFTTWVNPVDPKDIRTVQTNAELGVAPVRLSNGKIYSPKFN
jgi:hypothetical protein